MPELKISPMVKDGKLTQSRGVKAAENAECDLSLEPHVLTDKDDVKIAPCRTCRRPCVVTRFATPAKVACNEHRDRAASKTKLHEFDRTKEPHILTDKEKTKEVPCRACGRPCIVNVFASAEKVACLEHGGAAFRPKKTRKHIKDGDHYKEVVTTEVVNEAQYRQNLEVLATPGLPFWPDGSDADRQHLIRVAAEQAEARWVYYRLRAEYIARAKGPRRELRTIRTNLERAEEIMPPRDPERLREREERIKELESAIATLEKVVEEPKELVEARAAHDALVEERKILRRSMVDKLIKAGAEDPYAEVTDESTLEVGRIQPRHELELLAEVG